jgi:hypothetical protein
MTDLLETYPSTSTYSGMVADHELRSTATATRAAVYQAWMVILQYNTTISTLSYAANLSIIRHSTFSQRDERALRHESSLDLVLLETGNAFVRSEKKQPLVERRYV